MDTLPNQKIKILQKEEIQAEITRCEKLLMELKIKKNVNQTVKVHEFKQIRKYIAKLTFENNNNTK
tara:strand:+ start:499 stop:696 length:198 start_codon:yes stop_codon:yes gene_type:complete